jgi:hypothetical protein
MFATSENLRMVKTPKKVSWVRVPLRMVSVCQQMSKITAPRPKLFCFGEEITRTKATNPKKRTVLGSSFSEKRFLYLGKL